MRVIGIAVFSALTFCTLQPPLLAQVRSAADYRVVFASSAQLARQLGEASRDGYACVEMARADPGVGAAGVVVVLGRTADGPAAATHNVVVAGGNGADLGPMLARAGADGFRLCGVALDEGTAVPQIVAVMSRREGPKTAWHYGVEVLTNYKAAITNLNTAGRDGFRPVASSPINNNRVPDMRSWLVVTEREGDQITPREIAVRSNSGADGIQRALNEEGGRGFHADLIWKEGNDFVAMMSRETEGAKRTFSYTAESMDAGRLHFLSQLYLADFPYLTSGARLVVTDKQVSASADVEADSLPALGRSGFVDSSALAVLGDHLTRHRGFMPVASRISRAKIGTLTLTTVVVQRGQ